MTEWEMVAHLVYYENQTRQQLTLGRFSASAINSIIRALKIYNVYINPPAGASLALIQEAARLALEEANNG